MDVTYSRPSLYETKLSQFDTSGITDKAIETDGVGDTTLKSIDVKPDHISITFEVESSSDDGASQVSANGQPMAFMNQGYTTQLRFNNLNGIVPPNFDSLQFSQQQQILTDVFEKADVQVGCNCPSFYWQGMQELDHKSSNAHPDFTGHPGQGMWNQRHIAMGGPKGSQLCKHLWGVIEDLEETIPAMLKQIGSGSGTLDEPLEQPEAPAGTAPTTDAAAETIEQSDQAVDAAETEVATDVDEAAVTASGTDEPEMDTSDTVDEEKNEQSEVIEGPEEVDVGIQEPKLPATQNNKMVDMDQEQNTELLEEPLDDDDVLNESFERIYQSALRERYVPITKDLLDDSIMDRLDDIEGKPDWAFANLNVGNGKDVVEHIADDEDDESFLILSEDTPVGVIRFRTREGFGMLEMEELDQMDENSDDYAKLTSIYDKYKNTFHVCEIGLVGFKENSITLVKDVFKLLDEMFKKYPLVRWSVDNRNPIKRAYDRIIGKLGGFKVEYDDGWTRYFIEKKQSLKESNKSYFAAINGQQYGPYFYPQLLQYKNSGQLQDNTPLWTQGMQNWMPAKDIPELISIFNPEQHKQQFMQQQQQGFDQLRVKNQLQHDQNILNMQKDHEAKMQPLINNMTQNQQLLAQLKQEQAQQDNATQQDREEVKAANDNIENLKNQILQQGENGVYGGKFRDHSDDELLNFKNKIYQQLTSKKTYPYYNPVYQEIEAYHRARREYKKQNPDNPFVKAQLNKEIENNKKSNSKFPNKSTKELQKEYNELKKQTGLNIKNLFKKGKDKENLKKRFYDIQNELNFRATNNYDPTTYKHNETENNTKKQTPQDKKEIQPQKLTGRSGQGQIIKQEENLIFERIYALREETKYVFPKPDYDAYPNIDPNDEYRYWVDAAKQLPSRQETISIDDLVQDFDGDEEDDYDYSKFDGGVTQAIDVLEMNDGTYCIMDGNHRAAWSKRAGVKQIDANVYHVIDEEFLYDDEDDLDESLFERIYRLREKKDHLIKKLDKLTDSEKDEVIAFFKKHANLENKIDWNNKDLRMHDFRQLMKSNEQSRSNVKQATKADLKIPFADWVQRGDAHIWYCDNNLILVSPFTWACAQFMNSFNCYGTGAKWCIGYEQSPQHWNEYVIEKQAQFIFLYIASDKSKWMFERTNEEYYDVYDAEDNCVYSEANGFRNAFKHVLGWYKIEKLPIAQIEQDIDLEIEQYFYECNYEEKQVDITAIKNNLIDYYTRELLSVDPNDPNSMRPLQLYASVDNDLENDDESRDLDDNERTDIVNVVIEVVTGNVYNSICDHYRETKQIDVDDDWVAELLAAEQADLNAWVSEQDLTRYKQEWLTKKKALAIETEKAMGQQFLFEQIYALREKKDHIIKKLNIEDKHKDELIAFFNKHPGYENKINWQKKNLKYEDFADVLEAANNSRSAQKAKVKADLSIPFKPFEADGEAFIWYNDNKVILVSPLSWKCAQFMNSFDCYGTGAKWCIGMEEKSQHWNEYVVEKGNKFIFVFDAEKRKKFMLQLERQWDWSIWTAEDDRFYNEQQRGNNSSSIAELLSKIDVTIDNPDKVEDEINDIVDELFARCEAEGENNLKELTKELSEYYYQKLITQEIDPLKVYPKILDDLDVRAQNYTEENIFGAADEICFKAIENACDFFKNQIRIGYFTANDEFMVKLYLGLKVTADGEYDPEDYEAAKAEWEDDRPSKIREDSYTGYRGYINDDSKNFWEPQECSGDAPNGQIVGKWYSSDPDLADYYTAGEGEVIKDELEFDNEIILDAKGRNYDDIELEDGFKTNTDALAVRAWEDGHDGLVIENVQDPFPTNTYVALKPETIKSSELFESIYLRENKKHFITTCVEIGETNFDIWEDATEMAQDLGYWATFDDFEDPEDSNWEEISIEEFADACNYALPKHKFTYLKRYDNSLYCAYDEREDIHHFFG